MSVTYGFFNSVNGDRVYNADQMSEYFNGLVSNGVYESVGGALQVVPNTGMNVNVKTGRGIIDCKWINLDAILSIDITQSHPTLNRYTAVIIRLNITDRLMEITTKDGTAAANPTKPEMTNTVTTKELCLAYIYIAAGTTTITASNIEDMRASNLCGWVTGVVKQVDTSELFNQYSAAYAENLANMQAWEQNQKEQFDAWFETLTEQLQVNTHIERTFADTATTEATTVVMFPDALDYEDGDIIDVYINGVYLSPTEYTISLDSGANKYKITTTATLDEGNTITFSCLKSVIGNVQIV